ncbi:MAG: DUF4954 family protein [Paludibacteraceae bacterium]|nr:DUF4954 family protein [Paludibacteraceae bacterium]
MNYRKLTPDEIAVLRTNNCRADNWNNITVVDNFTPEYIENVTFSGTIKLGAFTTSHFQLGGIEFHSGIRNAKLHNVEIGNNCTIDSIHNYIANYNIGDNVIIENTNLIVTDGESTFGNGVLVPAINEGGGREIPIYDHLSSHMAYIIALYRHEPQLIAQLTKMINDYAESRRSSVGTIESNVRIFNCGTIKNTFVGEYTSLGGVSKLSNGSINSNRFAPVHLGSGVKCNDFIISSGTDITDSTLVSRCFIGQGCELGKHYSALDSVFFANCQGFHGEATAIFAGPYTVSHHKSSLLIAGMFSFLNAGSASNQSNHMYKLGPIHQGIVERGSKTTSNSYLLWPARVGAFTLVMGRHTKNSNTSDFPFSYLIENDTESYLIPGVNLRSVGTIRDTQKWPNRDRRKDPVKLDSINFNLLSPYTVQKMFNGIEILKKVRKLTGENNHTYLYENCHIRRSSLISGIEYYKLAIKKFIGNSIISRMTRNYDGSPMKPLDTFEELKKRLTPTTNIGLGNWVDLSGMICPRSEVDRMIAEIKLGKMNIIEAEKRIREIHENYYEYEWTWACDKLTRYLGKTIDELTKDDIVKLVDNWCDAVLKLDNMLYEDAKKEFNLSSHTGFGIDTDDTDRNADFEAVRGKFEENSFVKNCLQHMKDKEKLRKDTIALIDSLK